MTSQNTELLRREALTLNEAAELLGITTEEVEEKIFSEIIKVCVRFRWEHADKFSLYDRRSQNPFEYKQVSKPFRMGQLVRVSQESASKVILNGDADISHFHDEPRTANKEDRTRASCIEYHSESGVVNVTKDMILVSRSELTFWLEMGLFPKITKSTHIESNSDYPYIERARELADEYLTTWRKNFPLKALPGNLKIAEKIAPKLVQEGFKDGRGKNPPAPETIKRHALDGYLNKKN